MCENGIIMIEIEIKFLELILELILSQLDENLRC